MTDSGKLRLPHPLALLTGCVLLAAAASYVLPAGEFDRRADPVTGRTLVVPGTYQSVEANPVNLFEAMVALPRGMADAASVIFLVFLIGGAFTVVDETGALRRAIPSLIRALRGRDLLVVPVVSLFFATGGVVQNMQEEIIPLIPVLMILVGRLGFTPMVAVAMSAGAAFVGSAFSPINPFQVIIAQQAAEVEPISGALFRMVFLIAALALWIGETMRYAAATRTARHRDHQHGRWDVWPDGRWPAVVGMGLRSDVRRLLHHGLPRRPDCKAGHRGYGRGVREGLP